MKPAPILPNEPQRLLALQRYDILDTPPTPEFDDFTRLAASICGTPIALISLIDGGRQWFKSRVGLDALETPRDVSFCGHAIHHVDVFEVPDALDDERFADNPLVLGAPTVRFYAAAPLVTDDGYGIGTLCVIDHVPHRLSEVQRDTLRVLGRRLVQQLELGIALKRERCLNAELVAAREEAERANQAKSAFLSSMSHELRTPMNAIMGFGQILEGDGSLNSFQKDCLQEIMSASSHLLQLINEVLDLAKIESGRFELFPVVVDLSDAVDACIHLVRTLADSRGVSLCVDLAPETVAFADPVRLRQVLLNLLSNAVKYNREGGDVFFTARHAAPGRVRLSVADTGVGIPPERMAELFEPFSRLGAEGGEVEGTGIGLTITRKLVELMGGQVGVGPRDGGGTVFWIELPTEATEWQGGAEQCAAIEPNEPNALAVRHCTSGLDTPRGQPALTADPVAPITSVTPVVSVPTVESTPTVAPVTGVESSPSVASAPPVLGPPPAAAPGARQPKVLCVDDNPVNLKLMVQTLSRHSGAVAITADTAELALEMARAEPPNLILMDIDLPGMDGYQALKELQSDATLRHIPVVAVSANAMEGDIVRGALAGFVDYVTKPFDLRRLLEVVGHQLAVAAVAAERAASAFDVAVVHDVHAKVGDADVLPGLKQQG